jgi:hypothetical protein
MTRPLTTNPKPQPPVDAFSVATFCARHDISVAHFYRMRAEGRTPAEMRLGGRVLISKEAAQRWRREREREREDTNSNSNNEIST